MGVGRWVTRPPLWWLCICIVFVMQVVELVVAGIMVVGVKLVMLILVVSIENKQ